MIDKTVHEPLDSAEHSTTGTRAARMAARVGILALILLAVVIGVRPLSIPPPMDQAPAPQDFSVARALGDLETITAETRAMGTPGLAAAQAYLADQLTALGFETQISENLSVEQHAEAGVVTVAQSHNVLARLPGTDSTGAVLVAGHLDSVHTTTAASDCGGCSVGVLETARALRAGPPLRNDVIFLIEDGEETTRAGALSFVLEHPWAQDVRVALNQEAMGSKGASLLYVTGPQNGWLMRQALRAMPRPVAYSFANDLVWGTGTGGSDLDQYLMTAPVGLGLVYVGNVPAYHSMQDNVANLDLRTWQHQGDNILTMARHFGNLPLDGTLTAPDLVYFTLVEGVTVQYAAWVGIVLALLAAVGLIVLAVIGLRRKALSGRGILFGVLVFLPLMLAAMALSGALWYAIRLLDPRLQVFLIGISYDRPWYTLAFVALSAGLMTAGYALFKRTLWLELSVGAAAWWALLALLTAWRVPGSGPLFAWPVLAALPLLAVAVFGRRSSPGWAYIAVAAVAAAGAALIVSPAINFLGIFSGRAELIMGLPVIALLPAPLAAMLAGLLLPVTDEVGGGRRWVAPAALAALAAVILAGVALTADFNLERPKPNMAAYVMDENEAAWYTLGGQVGNQRASLLDEWTEQFFSQGAEETSFSPWGVYYMDSAYPAYRSPAPRADLPAPQFEVISDQRDAAGVRRVQLRVSAGAEAPMRVLRLEAASGLDEVRILGESLAEMTHVDAPAQTLWIEIYGLTGEEIALDLALRGEGGVTLMMEERLFSLPELADMPITPRPDWMMPSPTFVSDMTLARYTFTLP